MIRSIQAVYDAIKNQPKQRLAVAQAADGHVLQAVRNAWEEGCALPILVGDPMRIQSAAKAAGIDISPFELVSAPNDVDAAALAVRMVREGGADVVMKGLMESSAFLRAILNKETGIRKPGTLVSALAVMELKKLDR